MHLRLARVGDADDFAAIYGPVVTETSSSFETAAPDAAEMARRIAAHDAALPWIVIAGENDRAAGYAYAGAYRARAAYRFSTAVSIYVAREARGRRVGTRLYTALLALVREQGYRRAFADIALPNAASVALHVAQGFTLAGVTHAAGYKFDRWHDVAFFECALRELDAPTAPPLALAQLDPSMVQGIFTAG